MALTIHKYIDFLFFHECFRAFYFLFHFRIFFTSCNCKLNSSHAIEENHFRKLSYLQAAYDTHIPGTWYIPWGIPSRGACGSVTPRGDGTRVNRTVLHNHLHGSYRALMEGGQNLTADSTTSSFFCTWCDFYFFPSNLLSSPFLLLLPPSRISDPGSHNRLFPLPTTACVPCIFFYEKGSALSFLVDSRRIAMKPCNDEKTLRFPRTKMTRPRTALGLAAFLCRNLASGERVERTRQCKMPGITCDVRRQDGARHDRRSFRLGDLVGAF